MDPHEFRDQFFNRNSFFVNTTQLRILDSTKKVKSIFIRFVVHVSHLRAIAINLFTPLVVFVICDNFWVDGVLYTN